MVLNYKEYRIEYAKFLQERCCVSKPEKVRSEVYYLMFYINYLEICCVDEISIEQLKVILSELEKDPRMERYILRAVMDIVY
jgi:hypothetical protein